MKGIVGSKCRHIAHFLRHMTNPSPPFSPPRRGIKGCVSCDATLQISQRRLHSSTYVTLIRRPNNMDVRFRGRAVTPLP